ncbi:MAG: HAMP domain-containing histidine kinase [Deltaproteobacteria bacterium]|nr:HAMP domain-containing histidine kinase [Deltaproteobacteria bacterium]
MSEKVPSEKEQAEDMLRKAAHDLRSPLSIIHMFLQRLESDVLSDAKLKQFHVLACQASSKIEDMIESMRFEEKLHQPKCERHDLATLVQETVKGSKATAEQKKIEVDYVGPMSLQAYVDPKLLDRVVMNMLMNAVQASEPGKGSIAVELFLNGSTVFIDIADNGKGIPSENLEKIFLPGFTHGKADGTGIGLDVCKQVVEGHGGEIRVHSEERCGTIFTTVLPHAMPNVTAFDISEVSIDDTLDWE